MPRRNRNLRLPKPKNMNAVRTRWADTAPDESSPCPVYQRYYRIDSLDSAVKGMLNGNDPFFTPVIKGVLGPAGLASVTFTLARERLHELVFQAQAVNLQKKRSTFALVVARHHGEFSRQVAEEFQQTSMLAKRMPRYVPAVYQQGHIYLPENRRFKKKERKLDAYLRQWIPADGFPVAGRNGQICVVSRPPRLLSREATESVRCQITSLLATAWNPQQNEGIDCGALSSDDFLISHTASGNIGVRLVSCRKYGRILPNQFIESIAGMVWKNDDHLFSLLPDEPENFYNAVVPGMGAETARQVFSGWLDGKVRSGASVVAPEYAESLRRLLR